MQGALDCAHRGLVSTTARRQHLYALAGLS